MISGYFHPVEGGRGGRGGRGREGEKLCRISVSNFHPAGGNKLKEIKSNPINGLFLDSLPPPHFRFPFVIPSLITPPLIMQMICSRFLAADGDRCGGRGQSAPFYANDATVSASNFHRFFVHLFRNEMRNWKTENRRRGNLKFNWPRPNLEVEESGSVSTSQTVAGIILEHFKMEEFQEEEFQEEEEEEGE